MQFLVIEKVSTETLLPPEVYRQVPGILTALRDYNATLTKQGKVKASWNLADVPGGAYVLDVADANELTRLLTASPASAFPLTREIHPVSDVQSGVQTIVSAVTESIAHQDAMMKQQAATSSKAS